MINENEIKKEIDNHKIVSFDVFDTLLYRRFIFPTDIFSYIEEEYKAEGYRKNRINAEKEARKKSIYEINIDDIYRCIKARYKHLLEKELEIEKKSIYRNEKIYKLYKYALDRNKTIVFTSDMYLKYDFLVNILKENNYGDYNLFLLSNKDNVNKESGSIYKYMIDKLGCFEKDILHIGDNYICDYEIPTKLGIGSIFIDKPSSVYIKRYNKYQMQNNWKLSLIHKLIADKLFSNEIQINGKIGYSYVGPIIYSYITWINSIVKEINNIDKIVFVLRDGYLLSKAYKILYKDSNIETINIHASRSICNKYINNVDEYAKYLNYLGIKDNFVLVESISEKFSAQKLINKALNIDAICLYWYASNKTNKSLQYYLYQKKKINILKNYNLIEYMLSSPEPPAKCINNNTVVYENEVSINEKKHMEFISYVEKYALEFVCDMNKLNININTIENSVFNDYFYDYFRMIDDKERSVFESIRYSSNIQNNDNNKFDLPNTSLKDNIRLYIGRKDNIITRAFIFIYNICINIKKNEKKN